MATKTPMNRALPLLLLIALAVAGLAFIALEPGRGPGRQTGTEATLVDGDPTTRAAPAGQVPDSSRATGLANVPERDGLELAGGSGPAKSWEIVPLNGVGQLVPNARITATSSSEERTAMGRIRWQGVPSGPWSVVIESDGNPTWRREVDLAPQSNRRTAARLGDEMGHLRSGEGPNDTATAFVQVCPHLPRGGHPGGLAAFVCDAPTHSASLGRGRRGGCSVAPVGSRGSVVGVACGRP